MNNHEAGFGDTSDNAVADSWEQLAKMGENRQLQEFGADGEMVDVPSIQVRELEGFGTDAEKVTVVDDIKFDTTPTHSLQEFGADGKVVKFEGAPNAEHDSGDELKPFGSE